MAGQSDSIAIEGIAGRTPWPAERRFHVAFALALMASLVLGFGRTFFFRPLFPEWAAAHGAPEPFFYFHGALFFAWFALLVAQACLIATRRVDLHRRLGTFGAGLAAVMLVVGFIGALIAAARPGGFIDVPVPPLQFLIVPLMGLLLFKVFVALAIAKRRDAQSHKRLMLLATLAIIGAAVARWPFAFMQTPVPVPGFTTLDLMVDLHLLPMIVWDVWSRGRLHPVTLWGGLALIASAPVGFMISGTDAWLAFAGWAVGLLG